MSSNTLTCTRYNQNDCLHSTHIIYSSRNQTQTAHELNLFCDLKTENAIAFIRFVFAPIGILIWNRTFFCQCRYYTRTCMRNASLCLWCSWAVRVYVHKFKWYIPVPIHTRKQTVKIIREFYPLAFVAMLWRYVNCRSNMWISFSSSLIFFSLLEHF